MTEKELVAALKENPQTETLWVKTTINSREYKYYYQVPLYNKDNPPDGAYLIDPGEELLLSNLRSLDIKLNDDQNWISMSIGSLNEDYAFYCTEITF